MTAYPHEKRILFGRSRLALRLLGVIALSSSFLHGQAATEQGIVYSREARADVKVSTDATSAFWREAPEVLAQVNKNGETEAEYRTQVRSRWTKDNLYFLFICPYKRLYLKSKPDAKRETYELWKWNVAEVFIGSDFRNIKRYREFELSPQGEWVDLDINLDNPHHEEGWVWNSGFSHAARIDEARHVWYAAMRIPFRALDVSNPMAGQQFRVNFYRTEGPPSQSREIMWRPTMSRTFHVPDRFGLLRLAHQ